MISKDDLFKDDYFLRWLFFMDDFLRDDIFLKRMIF